MSHDTTPALVTFTPDQMAEAVKKLIRAGKALGRSVETCLVMAVYDSIANKSPAVAQATIDALRASTKKDGIVAFLEKFGQLAMVRGKFHHFALGSQESLTWDADYSRLVQEEAEAWEAFKPAKKESTLDVLESVQSLIKRASKEGATVENAGLVEYLKALVAQYVAREALAKAKDTVAAAGAQHAEKAAVTA